MRTIVYIDGFNLYYGCLKGTPFRWLDLVRLSEILLPQHEIHMVRYFTARISDRGNNAGQQKRQNTYLSALSRQDKVVVHLGHYLTHTVKMPIADRSLGLPVFVDVLKSEEKGSDVNLASYLLLDGFRKKYEQAVVISNDSDLKTPIELVRKELELPVGVVFPNLDPRRQPSQSLKKVALFVREIRKNALSESQLPAIVDGQIHKPTEW